MKFSQSHTIVVIKKRRTVQRRAITATYGTAAGSSRDLQVMRREEPRRTDRKNRNHMTCDELNRDFWT